LLANATCTATARLQAALCGDAALEQFAGISGVAAEVDAGKEFEVEDNAVAAAELAHGVLLRLCTEPSHGGGLYKLNPVVTTHP
jgi:hypothetical protein